LNSFPFNGPSVPGFILRVPLGGDQRRIARLALLLELVEQAVEVFSVEDEAGSLVERIQAWSPCSVEGPPLDTDVRHGFAVGQAALHQGLPELSVIKPTRHEAILGCAANAACDDFHP
jgi:hypothetical protein